MQRLPLSTSGGNWIPGLEPYLPNIPLDPINNSSSPWATGHYSYAYGNVGKTIYPDQYDLTAQLESVDDPDTCQFKNYKFYFNNQAWCGGYSPYIFEASQLKAF